MFAGQRFEGVTITHRSRCKKEIKDEDKGDNGTAQKFLEPLSREK